MEMKCDIDNIHYSHGPRRPITDEEQWASDDRLLECLFGPLSPEEIKSRDEARAEYLRKAAEPPEQIFDWEEIERLSKIAQARELHTLDELLNLIAEESKTEESTPVPGTP